MITEQNILAVIGITVITIFGIMVVKLFTELHKKRKQSIARERQPFMSMLETDKIYQLKDLIKQTNKISRPVLNELIEKLILKEHFGLAVEAMEEYNVKDIKIDFLVGQINVSNNFKKFINQQHQICLFDEELLNDKPISMYIGLVNPT
jgi:5-methylcytosine-specific restriction endonuclease McrBC regulatory subunit McrC